MSFDIKLHDGALPHCAQLQKYSPEEVEKETYRVVKEEKLGHLQISTDEQESERTTKAHAVAKKYDFSTLPCYIADGSVISEN